MNDNPYKPTLATNVETERRHRPAEWFALSLLTIVLLIIMVTRGTVRRTFADFEVALPAISVISVHSALVLVTALTLGAAVVVHLHVRRRKTAVLCQLSLAALGVVLLTVYALGTLLPFMDLLRSLS